jgi:exopolysaccharide biosynthesis operon protein EpsL
LAQFLKYWPIPAALLLGLLSGFAQAQDFKVDPSDTFSFNAGAGLAYDNNLLRLDSGDDPPDGRHRGSFIENTYLQANMDLPLSLQRIQMGVKANAFRYNEYSYLNWEGVDYNAAWLWALASRFKGEFSYDHKRALSSFTDFRANRQNLRDTDIAVARGEYQILARWAITVGSTWTKIENDNNLLSVNDVELFSFGTGMKYRSPANNSITFGVRHTNGEFPNRAHASLTGDTGFDQFDYGAEVDYHSGPWRLLGGLGYTQRRFDNLHARDFNGITGRLEGNWEWTGKTGLSAKLARELVQIEDPLASYSVNTSLRVAPYWLPTVKTRVEVPVQWSKVDYEGSTLSTTGGQQRNDKYLYTGLATSWMPNRNWRVGASLTYSKRNSNISNNDFNDVTTMLNARFAF